ncbi:MAG: hypothetical protein WBH50_15690 [Fuerstiella sp.]
MNSASTRQQYRLLLPLMLFEILLIAATLPLWSGSSSFPAIPLLKLFVAIPSGADAILTFLLVLNCTATFFLVLLSNGHSPQTSTSKIIAALTFALLTGGTLVLLNQHRLQPWHWLFLVLSLQCLILRPERQEFSQRLTIASIYIFAGLSRLGPEIDSGMSREVLTNLLSQSGLTTAIRNQQLMTFGCIGMTLTEILAGVLLLAPKWRRAGVILAMTAHVILLIALGPWGLNHNNAVLIWNIFFIVAVPLLFWKKPTPATLASEAPIASPSESWMALTMNCCIVAFPLLGLIGISDNWPSWQLYSPRPEVVRLFVSQNAVPLLPEQISEYIDDPPPLQPWCPIRMDRWSLEATRSPIYPEDRFQLGVVAAILPDTIADGDFRIMIESAAEPAWWRRTTREISSVKELDELRATMFFSSAVRLPN